MSGAKSHSALINEDESASPPIVPNSSQSGQFKVYKYRWVVSVVYFLIGFANAITWITYSPIANMSREYYGVSRTGIDMLAMIFMITYIPLAFVGSWTLDRGGLSMGTMIGAGFTILGVWVRLLGRYHYAFALIGQAICSLAQPFLLSAAPKLAANWFGDEQRAVATTIASLANPVGVAIGFVLPTMLADSPDQIPRMLLIEAIIITVLSYPTFIFMLDNPPTPPSLSAMEKKEENFMESLKIILVNKNMWILFFEFGIGLGAFNCLATVLNGILMPYGYTDNQCSAIGAAVVLSGLVGSGIAGVILDKTNRYKAVLVSCLVLATISVLTFTVTLKRDRFGILLASSLGLGFSTTPIIPVTFETSAEMMFPLGEATPVSFLLNAGQIAGIGFVIGMGKLIDDGNVFWANIIVVISLGVSALVSLFLNVDLKRTRFDERRTELKDEDPLIGERRSLLQEEGVL